MIRYTLSCKAEHRFESWFPSAAGFDALLTAGQLACPAFKQSIHAHGLTPLNYLLVIIFHAPKLQTQCDIILH